MPITVLLVCANGHDILLRKQALPVREDFTTHGLTDVVSQLPGVGQS